MLADVWMYCVLVRLTARRPVLADLCIITPLTTRNNREGQSTALLRISSQLLGVAAGGEQVVTAGHKGGQH